MMFDLIGWFLALFVIQMSSAYLFSRDWPFGDILVRKRPDGVIGAFRVHEGVWGLSWDNRGH
jgi:hypothetical protein